MTCRLLGLPVEGLDYFQNSGTKFRFGQNYDPELSLQGKS